MEEKRKRMLSIPVSEREKAAVKRAAEAEHMPVAIYVRRLILEDLKRGEEATA